MAFTNDITTDVGKLRLLLVDVDSTNPIFQDNELEVFLSLKNSNLQRAAALAYRVMAGNQTLVLKVIKLLQLSTDGASVGRELRQLATAFDDSATFDEASSGDLFDWAEMVLNPFSERERLLNEIERNQIIGG